MKKKALIGMLIMVLVCINASGAYAGSGEYNGSLPEEMFIQAKSALALMSYGSYEDALELLGIGGVSAKDFKFFAETSFSTLSGEVQQDVAVACKGSGTEWIIAVPLLEPSAMDVEAFLLHSSDGETFDGYTAATWGAVDDIVADANEVIWCYRYEPDGKYVIVS